MVYALNPLLYYWLTGTGRSYYGTECVYIYVHAVNDIKLVALDSNYCSSCLCVGMYVSGIHVY